jgi:hypothetical protein
MFRGLVVESGKAWVLVVGTHTQRTTSSSWISLLSLPEIMIVLDGSVLGRRFRSSSLSRTVAWVSRGRRTGERRRGGGGCGLDAFRYGSYHPSISFPQCGGLEVIYLPCVLPGEPSTSSMLEISCRRICMARLVEVSTSQRGSRRSGANSDLYLCRQPLCKVGVGGIRVPYKMLQEVVAPIAYLRTIFNIASPPFNSIWR